MSYKASLVVAAVLLNLTIPALGQQDSMGQVTTSGRMGEVPPADRAFMASMAKMQQAMNVPMSGDADRDFARMMIPHHQAAIDMAKAELRYGKDAAMLQLAKAIVTAQEHEIAAMRRWLDRQAP